MTTIVLNDDIRNEAELNTAIEQAATYSSGTTLVIGFGANVDIKLNSALAAINLQSGVTLDIVGDDNAVTLDGNGQQRGLFVYSGVVNITNLTIANTVATGGAGADEGGGGAGLGGGLFVAGATTPGGGGASGDPGQQVVPVVTLSNVIFKNDSAVGGIGGAGGNNGSGGGGGGLGGAGAAGSQGAGGPGFGVPSFGAGGAGTFGGTGGAGGFGGGGGGTISGVGSPGGFGGGGASGFDETFIPTGGTGGSSGGGGGEFIPLPSGGPGGFGAGAGGMQTRGGGGGGLGAGGDIFVQGGATLIINGGSSVRMELSREVQAQTAAVTAKLLVTAFLFRAAQRRHRRPSRSARARPQARLPPSPAPSPIKAATAALARCRFKAREPSSSRLSTLILAAPPSIPACWKSPQAPLREAVPSPSAARRYCASTQRRSAARPTSTLSQTSRTVISLICAVWPMRRARPRSSPARP